MSVVTVKERWDRRACSESALGQRSYTRVFYVETDGGATDHGDVVLAASGIPKYNEAHPSDQAAYVRSRTPRAVADNHWEVTIDYVPVPGQSPGEGTAETSILFMEPRVEVSFEAGMEPLEGSLRETRSESARQAALYAAAKGASADGTELFSTGAVNSAGEPFDPPIMIRYSLPIINITRNEPTFDLNRARTFIDTVNAGEIIIVGVQFSKHECMMMGLSTPGHEYTTFNDIRFSYYPVTYTIHVNWRTWDHWKLNQGTFYLDGGDTSKPIAFETVDVNGNKTGQRYVGLLKADGDKQTDPTNPTFEHFPDANREADWEQLFLPKRMPPLHTTITLGDMAALKEIYKQ